MIRAPVMSIPLVATWPMVWGSMVESVQGWQVIWLWWVSWEVLLPAVSPVPSAGPHRRPRRWEPAGRWLLVAEAESTSVRAGRRWPSVDSWAWRSCEQLYRSDY